MKYLVLFFLLVLSFIGLLWGLFCIAARIFAVVLFFVALVLGLFWLSAESGIIG